MITKPVTHEIERVGRQTTHYIKLGNGVFAYFTRGVGQTEEDARAMADHIVAAINTYNPQEARRP